MENTNKKDLTATESVGVTEMQNMASIDRLRLCMKKLNESGFEARDWCPEQISVSCESDGKNADENVAEFDSILEKYGCEKEAYDAGTMVVWAEEDYWKEEDK